jgi:molecular chaperone DnaK
MQKDAEANSNEDAKKRDLVEAKNFAEQLIYTAEKSLKDNGDKIEADLKTSVESKVSDLKKEKDGNDLESIKKATESLSSEISKIGEAINKASQNQNQTNQNDQNKDSNVKDAEFEEKKEGEDK